MATEAFKETMIELNKDYVEFCKVKHKDITSLSFKDYVELYVGYLSTYNNHDFELDEGDDSDESE